ncbi:SusC/RagA family TonB-linked outer membrane protein [Flavobacterium sp. ARAG 55.4]|uniref:SusC/RagA family TonB-linked outer membrane protein n=1 Tax=Flavobacterium sp. ARAG 55.4 TaxID=3451357 RepID=UPI003F463929
MIKELYKKLIFFFTFFVILSINAQEGDSYILKGKVTDEFNAPLSGALVTAGKEGKTYSDQKGEFQISISKATSVKVAKDDFESQEITISEMNNTISVSLIHTKLFLQETDKINLPFGKLEKGRIVGSVSNINIEEHLSKDQRIGVGSAITGKVGGVFNNANVLGFGSAVYIVDGIPRSIDFVNLTEIEDITVLKDPVSRVLYGSAADKGVILITTKRGKVEKKNLTVRADYGIQTAVAKPKYLNAADYMEVYNQANLNDGKAIKYSDTKIADTRNGVNPMFNPDVDYYSSTFLRNNVNYLDVNMEASGGTSKVQYMLTAGLSNNQGWLKLGSENERTDRFNIRANTNYSLSSKLKMNLDAVSVFKIYNSPDVFDLTNGVVTSDFWTKAQTNLPNSYPLLIPISSISDPASYLGADLIDGQYLLGGTNEFTRNIYGDLTRRGNKTITDRYFQINSGLDWDLSFLTKGLTFKTNLTFDFFNTSVENQNKSYAVYQPVMVGNDVSVVKIGADVPSNEKSVNAAEAYFTRRLGFYSTLNYKRDFGIHSLDVTALSYLSQFIVPNVFQSEKSLNYGIRANYMLANKYVLDFSGAVIGSSKMAPGNRFGFSPTAGLGWIISNEDFFHKNGATDFLELRGTVGLLKNDNWNDYFLYDTSFSRGNYFNYSNTSGNSAIRNQELNYNNVGANIDWQKRLEFNIGFEGLFFNKSLYADASFFHSKSYDLITALNNSTPDLLGYTITANNNAFVDNGFEYTIRYKKAITKDVKIDVGYNTIFSNSKVSKMDEPIYGPNAQTRVRTGNASGAMFGLTANGLYGVSDFNTDGTLVTGLPKVSYGNVQPGDVKYIDINNDGIIDDNDQSIIGNNRPDMQYSLDLNVSYKNFDFYVLGVGQVGQDQYRNSAYFWTYGDLKYSETALQAYGPNNQDVNATMPRLSSTKNNNNYRNSTYWLYKNNFFTIPTLQLSYNIKGKEKGMFNSVKLFVKGNNLIVLNKNKDIENLRFGVGSSPITKGVSIGVLTSF